MNGPRSCCLLNFNPQNLLFRNCCHRSFSEEVAFCLSSLLFNNDIVVIVFVCFIVFPLLTSPKGGGIWFSFFCSHKVPPQRGRDLVQFLFSRKSLPSLFLPQRGRLVDRYPSLYGAFILISLPLWGRLGEG